MAIKWVILVNNSGSPRLTRFYEQPSASEQQRLVRTAFQTVAARPDGVCSFVEDEEAFGKGTKVVYRVFATLYFVVCVDEAESELGIVDFIQVFVETLDRVFDSVCELDIIFGMDKAGTVLDEMVCGGMVIETSTSSVLAAYQDVQKELKVSDSKPLPTAQGRPQPRTR
jgi:AP-3 complex subunit sigma|mmetsp:Transcript_4726/g.14545  ORF Transcript_4726/g.14545 Transcript_4726/m.14545 type:complete len:169 (-) Transcript_4726:706-1212(-)